MNPEIIEKTPTPLGFIVAVSGAVLAAWGLYEGARDSLVVGLSTLMILVASYFHANLLASQAASRITRTVLGEPIEGYSTLVSLNIDNSMGFIPIIASLKDDPPENIKTIGSAGARILLPPGATKQVVYTVIPRPGKRRFRGTTLEVTDPLGLYKLTLRVRPGGDNYLAGIPRPARTLGKERILKATETAPLASRLVRGPGTEFYAVREYVEGDDPRLIEWKATARLQRLMVKELRIEAASPIVIVAMPGPGGDEGSPGDTPFEVLSRTTAGLAEDLSGMGYSFGYIAPTPEEPVTVPVAPGLRGYRQLLYAIANTPPKFTPESPGRTLSEYLSKHVRARSLVLVLAGPGVDGYIEEIWEVVAELGLQLIVLRAKEGGVEIEWRR